MKEIRCLACEKKFKAKRSTATFCSESCRSNFHQKKQRRERQLTQLRKQEKACQYAIEKAQNSLVVAQEEAKSFRHKVEQIEERAKQVEKLLSLDDKTLATEQQWNHIFHVAAIPFAVRPNWITALFSGFIAYRIFQRTPEIMRQIRHGLEQEKKSLLFALFIPQMELKKHQHSIQHNESILEQQKRFLKEIHPKIHKLEKEVATAQKRRPNTSSALPHHHEVNTSSGLKPSELLKLNFNTFSLSGNIGKFLGQLERHKMSIALTGDPGAGKSNFSVALAQAFGLADLTVAYYSLEMGIGNALKDIVKRYPLPDTVSLFDVPELEDVKQKAAVFDVVIVDSFSKLKCPAIVLDELRHQFPHTIFGFILQKTSDGSTRGGKALDYDASMLMDVTINEEGRRQVYMKKSRYGTIGWKYFPEEDEVIPAGN